SQTFIQRPLPARFCAGGRGHPLATIKYAARVPMAGMINAGTTKDHPSPARMIAYRMALSARLTAISTTYFRGQSRYGQIQLDRFLLWRGQTRYRTATRMMQ